MCLDRVWRVCNLLEADQETSKQTLHMTLGVLSLSLFEQWHQWYMPCLPHSWTILLLKEILWRLFGTHEAITESFCILKSHGASHLLLLSLMELVKEDSVRRFFISIGLSCWIENDNNEPMIFRLAIVVIVLFFTLKDFLFSLDLLWVFLLIGSWKLTGP